MTATTAISTGTQTVGFSRDPPSADGLDDISGVAAAASGTSSGGGGGSLEAAACPAAGAADDLVIAAAKRPKNSSASFLAVESISLAPSWAILPPTCACAV